MRDSRYASTVRNRPCITSLRFTKVHIFMADRVLVTVPNELEPLIPRFLANRQKEIVKMQAFLAQADFDALKLAGHTLKGVGGGYGFPALSELGARFEVYADARDLQAVAAALDEYSLYMTQVDVRFE